MNIIESLLQKQDLDYSSMQEIMHNIMHGNCSSEWIAAFLVAMRAKGMTSEELLACIELMHKIVTPVKVSSKNVVDVVGTGGDGIHTFNISTASMIVAAAGGAKVAKHGNRSISSKSGSADVLESLGINLNQSCALIAKSIEEIGLGFMFAPHHHPAMKYVANVRKALGIHSFFNVLGPLTNPANVKRMLVGVYSKEWLETIANVLLKLNFEHAFVVHAENGMDEVSSSVKTHIYEVKNGVINNFILDPLDYGFVAYDIKEIFAVDSKHSSEIILNIFKGNKGAAFDTVVINSAIVLYISDLADSIASGIKMAQEVILDGRALAKLEEFKHFSNHIHE